MKRHTLQLCVFDMFDIFSMSDQILHFENCLLTGGAEGARNSLSSSRTGVVLMSGNFFILENLTTPLTCVPEFDLLGHGEDG